MSEKSKTSDTRPDPANAAISAMSELQKTGFGSLAWMGTAWLENLSDVGAEVMEFVAERVREDVKTQHELLHAKDVAEMQHIQAQFMQKAVDQYAAESGKLVEMSSELLAKAQAKKPS